ncbi:MAG: metal-sensitive transcriptional regulator [Synergistaceae bacterium]|nr:metal-sensitive transcriptional regulator [Synergistaceae bacterium]
MPKKSLIKELDELSPERKAMLNRLKRVEGQLRGIQRMIIEDKPCHATLVQMSAARKAMQQACIEILKNYVRKCLAEQGETDLGEMESLIGTLIDIAPIPSSSNDDGDISSEEGETTPQREPAAPARDPSPSGHRQRGPL